MDDTPHHTADWDPPLQSEAELTAGLTGDGDALIRELYASAAQLAAEQQSRKAAGRG